MDWSLVRDCYVSAVLYQFEIFNLAEEVLLGHQLSLQRSDVILREPSKVVEELVVEVL